VGENLGHTIGLAVIAPIVVGMFFYTAWKSRQRKGTHWYKYGPTYLSAMATPLILLNPVDHVISDQLPDVVLHIRKDGTLACTIIGFFLFGCSTLWNANIGSKLKDFRTKWRQLRDAK